MLADPGLAVPPGPLSPAADARGAAPRQAEPKPASSTTATRAVRHRVNRVNRINRITRVTRSSMNLPALVLGYLARPEVT